MERSKKVIFVPHCILNQNVKPIGKERYPGVVKELMELFSEADVGIVQMPCPQLEFNAGLGRKQKPKHAYDTKAYRDKCRKMAKTILKQIEGYLQKKYKVLGILGVEFSPNCAVHQLEEGSKLVPGKGILMEEIEAEMRKKKFQVPIIGIDLNNLYSSMEKIQALLSYS